jgi:crotonobetainyl-CoA:carnitine CoA-transferase CaiB-like acyl-CoA transferase
MTSVMKGLRILEVAEQTFVPLASGILADWGADVIKIEPPGRGDAMRNLETTAGVQTGGDGINLLIEHANRGKRSLALDLRSAEGQQLLYRLATTSDVFLTNKLPRVRASLKLDVDHIRAHNPRIVYVRGTGYGSRGPDVDLGGYDSLGYWARSGVGICTKPPDSEEMPGQPAPAFGDAVGAMYIATGIVAALLHRERTGEAPVVDVSLLAAGMWQMSAAIPISQKTGVPQVRRPDNRMSPRNPTSGQFRTADGQYVALGMLQAFEYWPELCRVLGHPEWVEDPRFATREDLFFNGWEAADLVAGVIATAPLDAWKERLRDLKGQWSPVQDSLTVAGDPMVVANGYIQPVRTRDGKPFQLVTSPIQFDNAPSPPRRAPEQNEHGRDILRNELGLDDGAIADLRRKGIVD